VNCGSIGGERAVHQSPHGYEERIRRLSSEIKLLVSEARVQTGSTSYCSITSLVVHEAGDRISNSHGISSQLLGDGTVRICCALLPFIILVLKNTRNAHEVLGRDGRGGRFCAILALEHGHAQLRSTHRPVLESNQDMLVLDTGKIASSLNVVKQLILTKLKTVSEQGIFLRGCGFIQIEKP